MKKLFATIGMVLIFTLVFSLNCFAEETGAEPAGEEFDVGDFQVFVPEGWSPVPVADMLGEKDADGNYPNNPASILLVQGEAVDEYSARKQGNINIIFWGNSKGLDSRSVYENVEELDVTINGEVCDAFQGDTRGYTYQIIDYNTDAGRYQILIAKATDGNETGISVERPEVMTILEKLE